MVSNESTTYFLLRSFVDILDGCSGVAAIGRVDKFYFSLDLQTSGDFPLFLTTMEEFQMMFCTYKFLPLPPFCIIRIVLLQYHPF